MKTITTLQGKIIVDESAEIKEGDYCDYPPFGIGQIKNINDELCFDTIPIKGIGSLTQRLYQCKDECQKVIVTINHSISLDVPMVIVEYEADTLLQPLVEIINEGYDAYDSAHHLVLQRWLATVTNFITSYKAAQQKGVYSEADLIAAMKYEATINREFSEYGTTYKTREKFIQSLNQEPIELERDHPNRVYYDGIQGIKITRGSDGQLMAYLKS